MDARSLLMNLANRRLLGIALLIAITLPVACSPSASSTPQTPRQSVVTPLVEVPSPTSTTVPSPIPTAPSTGTTTRLSVAPDGADANGSSESPSISADGRYVAYVSVASNLVLGDTNQCYTIAGIARSCADIFVYDTQSGTTQRVSVANDGSQGNRDSGWRDEAGTHASISADGHWVVFHSDADNLLKGDTRSHTQVYIVDLSNRRLALLSLSSDRSSGNGDSLWPTVSQDGRYIAYVSAADNLVAGDTNNACGTNFQLNCPDVFVHDRQTGKTERVSVSSDGTQGNSVSGHWYAPAMSVDGRYVVFTSWASNLVPGDTNYAADVFVHDRQTGKTERVSIAGDGSQANGESTCGTVSADGRYVGFTSEASNLVVGDSNRVGDAFVHDRQTGKTTRVSLASDGTQADGQSSCPRLSLDGRYVAFASTASNLVQDDTNDVQDVFLHDRETQKTERISLATDGVQGNKPSGFPSISRDARFITFASQASNLVSNDTNNRWDIFIRDRMAWVR